VLDKSGLIWYKSGTLREVGKAMGWRPWRRRNGAGAAAPDFEEILARAARLGITPDRVLEEYRRIAFANLRHIVDWDDGTMKVKAADQLGEDDVAAIAEIVQSAGKGGKPYRVKLYDKKAALDAIARYLGMIPAAAARPADDEPTPEEAQHARQRLIDALDRLAAQAGEGSGGQQSGG
jgi:hypothetical protein